MLEVQGPQVAWVGCAQAIGTLGGRDAESAALALALGHSQSLLAPDPLNALAVERPTLGEQVAVGSAVAPAGLVRRQAAQPPAQRLVIGRRHRLVVLGRSVLAGDLARGHGVG